MYRPTENKRVFERSFVFGVTILCPAGAKAGSSERNYVATSEVGRRADGGSRRESSSAAVRTIWESNSSVFTQVPDILHHLPQPLSGTQ